MARIRSLRPATIVTLLWALVILGVTVRVYARPKDNTVYVTYEKAGAKWVKGPEGGKKADLYRTNRGFVYPPPIAAFFAPFSKLSLEIGGILWRYLNIGVFLAAVAWWLRSGITQGLSPSAIPWIFLALLPLSLGSFNNGQVNPIMIALCMIGILGCYHARYTLAALAITAVTYLKIYPLSIGLLLVLLYPKRFSWRLLLALGGFGVLSLYLQEPEWVKRQYKLWWAFRMADNRFEYDNLIASRDFLLILRALHIPITQPIYQAIQLLGAAAVAGVILWGRWHQWAKERLLSAVFYLGVGWMILLGPSTESSTYTILAPAFAFTIAQAFSNPRLYSKEMRVWVLSSVGVLLLSYLIIALLNPRNPYFLALQPVAALLFVSYAIATLREKYWAANPQGAPSLSSAQGVSPR